MMELIATASSLPTLSIHGFTSSNLTAMMPWNENLMLTDSTSSANRSSISLSVSLPSGDGADGGPISIRRSMGGAPAWRAGACIRAGYCSPCLRSKLTTWTVSSPSTASRMANKPADGVDDIAGDLAYPTGGRCSRRQAR
ncbi:hypothetical protein MLD38_040542 [Melastoma candidum]|nr:hypothetical protein MLD38_040542 [Melastoma candidum]